MKEKRAIKEAGRLEVYLNRERTTVEVQERKGLLGPPTYAVVVKFKAMGLEWRLTRPRHVSKVITGICIADASFGDHSCPK